MHQRIYSSSANQTTELRHGSSAAQRHFGGRAIFSDPCSLCGTKKRRLLTVEDSTSEPDRKRSSSFDAAQSTPPPPAADMFRRCNSFPVISTAAAAVKPVDLLSRLNACTVVSPATAKRPPPAPSAVLRSFSDVTPATAIRDGRSTQVELVRRLKACTVSSPATAPDGGNRRDSPNASPHQERMLKEIKAGLEELMNRVDCITGGTDELFNDSDDENHVEELNGEQESGVCETVAFMHKCDCGKQFQVFLTAKSV